MTYFSESQTDSWGQQNFRTEQIVKNPADFLKLLIDTVLDNKLTNTAYTTFVSIAYTSVMLAADTSIPNSFFEYGRYLARCPLHWRPIHRHYRHPCPF